MNEQMTRCEECGVNWPVSYAICPKCFRVTTPGGVDKSATAADDGVRVRDLIAKLSEQDPDAEVRIQDRAADIDLELVWNGECDTCTEVRGPGPDYTLRNYVRLVFE